MVASQNERWQRLIPIIVNTCFALQFVTLPNEIGFVNPGPYELCDTVQCVAGSILYVLIGVAVENGL